MTTRVLGAILDRILRHIDSSRLHFQKSRHTDQHLPEMTDHERRLAEEFVSRVDTLHIESSDGMQGAQRAWNDNMLSLRQLVQTNDPRNFLSWSVVGGTMFVKYAKYSRPEYRFLRGLENWPRWKMAIKEDSAGNPLRCPFDASTSCNLVHHAYHIAQFEKFSNEDVSQYKYVMEFGGGYGSMCRLFFKLGFVGRYLIIDLPAFSMLQEYYLKSIGINVLSRDEFISGKNGVHCVSDLDSLGELTGSEKSLFLATWSISESPISVREKVLGRYTDAFDAFLVAFQPRFEDVDNLDYFKRWQANHPNYSWQLQEMEYLPRQRYLFGKRLNQGLQ